MEINFVDVGQGDGCFIVTPRDKWIIVDAGQEDNMYRFLRWRFQGFKRKFTFESAIITHPDGDHFEGFKPLKYRNLWDDQSSHRRKQSHHCPEAGKTEIQRREMGHPST